MGNLNTTVFAQVNGIDKRTPDEGTATAVLNVAASARFAPGTGAGKADLLFTDNRTIAAGASDVISLTGVLSDAFGDVLTMAKVKAIMIKPAPANANKITLSSPSGHAFAGPFGATGLADVMPGGALLFYDPLIGWAVTAGDTIALANAGSAAVTYEIAILGASA